MKLQPFLRLLSAFILIFTIHLSYGQSIPKEAYQNLEYRMIGPFRASRTVGGMGVPDQPNMFFIGVNNGGVWKTDDFGRTWNPIFDDAPTGSVGDIAVFPKNPDIIYLGSGEGLHRPDLGVGDGIFKTTNGGKTWEHVGLFDVQQVGRIIIYPTNPDIVYVAGLGHPYGANEERGVFKTVDGGKTWEKVFYIDENTGSIQVEFDPTNPEVLYADMWEHREGPWENARFSGTKSGLYKSIDAGATWKPLTNGLPGAEDGVGRIGVGISPSNSQILYGVVDARKNGGIYRSDDGGESWRIVSTERRLWGRGGDFAEIKVHPQNPDRIYVGNVASYTSGDGGKTWMSLKGAPGGDDYHRIWINPNNPDIMLFVADQGAVVTVNGGRTWSSWYNQPTSQLYHVATDNQFPYWVYGGQQESGAIGIASRANGGQITFREFMGVGSDEYAYVAPDPKDPNIIYGGRVMKFNKKTGQSQNVAPEALRSGKYRILRTMPLLFHPADDNMLLFATNVLWKTMNGGNSWEKISPDLSREQPEVPSSIGDFTTDAMKTMPRRGVIYAVAPSPLDVNTIWAGTDDGLVHITKDGGQTWKDVTPSALKSWDKVSQIDASYFDENAAYIAINAIRKDDMKPYIYKTSNGGESWELITNGMNPSGPVNVVRADPRKPGVLYAGTEREVYFSVDEGTHWQSLRNNMPATSIRDLVIKENDLVVGTHGRSIWILDNIHPIRQMADAIKEKTFFFSPSDTYRVRDNMFSDTPLPPEEPTGQNPPDGAIFDYYLASHAKTVALKIKDRGGNLVRVYSSDDSPEVIDTTALAHPTYWIKPETFLSTEKGQHRFVWDLRYAPPKGAQRQFSIAAVKDRTPSGPHGPLALPTEYWVELIVDGNVINKGIRVMMDLRVESPMKDLRLQHEYSMTCYEAYHELEALKEAIDAKENPSEALLTLRGNGSVGDPDTMYGSISVSAQETLIGLQRKFLFMMNLLQSADVAPTNQTINGVEKLQQIKTELVEQLKDKL